LIGLGKRCFGDSNWHNARFRAERAAQKQLHRVCQQIAEKGAFTVKGKWGNTTRAREKRKGVPKEALVRVVFMGNAKLGLGSPLSRGYVFPKKRLERLFVSHYTPLLDVHWLTVDEFRSSKTSSVDWNTELVKYSVRVTNKQGGVSHVSPHKLLAFQGLHRGPDGRLRFCMLVVDRDRNTARCILVIGLCLVYDIDLPNALRRGWKRPPTPPHLPAAKS